VDGDSCSETEVIAVADTVAQVMTRNPICVRADAPVSEAARRMADAGVGAVIVVEGEQVLGICTDRDITVRVTAAGRGADTPLQQACSDRHVVAIPATTTITDAARLMREHAVRRLPVLDEHRLVGIVSLADLARAQDPNTALSGISEAPPNR
jgi:CBS domain-containing protein